MRGELGEQKKAYLITILPFFFFFLAQTAQTGGRKTQVKNGTCINLTTLQEALSGDGEKKIKHEWKRKDIMYNRTLDDL